MNEQTTKNRLVAFESALEKVRLGINKKTWKCSFYNQESPSYKYWMVEAVSGVYSIVLSYTDKGIYNFTVKQKDVVLYEVKESDRELEFNFIRDYFVKLLQEYEKLMESLID